MGRWHRLGQQSRPRRQSQLDLRVGCGRALRVAVRWGLGELGCRGKMVEDGAYATKAKYACIFDAAQNHWGPCVEPGGCFVKGIIADLVMGVDFVKDKVVAGQSFTTKIVESS
jgi:hypothetical protein